MKRAIVIAGIVLLTLVGCTKEESVEPDEQKTIHKENETEIQQLKIDATTLNFVVDWLSNEEILFVRKNDNSIYELNAYNLFTKELTTIYQDDAIITNVLVHPLKESFLIHTSTNATAATLKVITIDGAVQNEITIESTELEIAWNDLNPSYLLLTAFYEDWSFDTFFYNRSNNHLELLQIDDPFPKWVGEEQFITAANGLDAEDLYVHNALTEQVAMTGIDAPIFFDTYEDALFIIHETENGQASYKVMNLQEEVLMEASLPALYEELQFFTTNVAWLMKNQLLFFQPSRADGTGITEQYQLMKLDEEGLEEILEEVDDINISCSPNGEQCIIGKHFDQVVNLKTYEKQTWLLLQD